MKSEFIFDYMEVRDMSKKDFTEIVKCHMRNHKNKWLMGRYHVDSHEVDIKLFNKYIQILTVDGIYCGGCEMRTQKEVIEYINECVA